MAPIATLSRSLSEPLFSLLATMLMTLASAAVVCPLPDIRHPRSSHFLRYR